MFTRLDNCLLLAVILSTTPTLVLSLPVANNHKAINVTARAEDAYQHFLNAFGLQHLRAAEDESMIKQRRALFEARREEVEKHNSRVGVTWTAAVNHFADSTEEERQARLGYKPSTMKQSSVRSRWVSAARMAEVAASDDAATTQRVESSVDWSNKGLQTVLDVRDQGNCGSCWAVASVGALEAHAELKFGNSTRLSYMNLVDCVLNPQKCGGNGGCDGATAELAFDYVKKHGIVDAQEYEQSKDRVGDACHYHRQQGITVDDFVQLPTNKVQPVLQALANKGPLVAGIEGSNFFHYGSGIFSECSRDAVVNHAVLLVGYGRTKDEGINYWLLRNSWGPLWGENGFMRMLRHDDDSLFCGTDYWPQQGNGCDGGPSQIEVCGMCGILSDVSYPIGVRMVRSDVSKPLVQSATSEIQGMAGNLRRRN